MALAQGHKQNFDTLLKAIQASDCALMECQLASTGEAAAVTWSAWAWVTLP